jgi:hypothetical protein
MGYIKGILSGLAAIFVAEFVFVWPFLKGSKSRWTGCARMDARREPPLAQILDCRPVTVWNFLRGQSGQCSIQSVVFLDSDAHGFDAGLFDYRDVRISLHNLKSSVTVAAVPAKTRRG